MDFVPEARRPDTPQAIPASLEVARRLIRRELHSRTQPDARELARALDRVWSPVFANLRDAVGDDGCAALLNRAFSKISLAHPVLRSFRGPGDSGIRAEHILTAIDAHGAPAAVAAVEELLRYLADLLTQLIGEEMAMRIIDHDSIGPRTGDEGRSP